MDNSVIAKVDVSVYGERFLVFQTSDHEQIINETFLKQYNVQELVFSELDDKDVEWFDVVLNYAPKNACTDLYFMGHYVGERIIQMLNDHRQDLHNAQMHFSVSIASVARLYNDDYVSCFTFQGIEWGICPFNAWCLRYSSFMTLLPKAKELASFVRMNTSGNYLERLIVIDNWFQENIQYIKSGNFPVGDKIYSYPEISSQAIVPDVLCKHYGTCEDISASIVAILSILGIDADVIAANGHAWVTIEMEGSLFIWDCTHNITRNPYKVDNELKAKEYSNIYTLIGYLSDKDYCKFGPLKRNVSSLPYSRDAIEKMKKKIIDEGIISFSYSNVPPYKSNNN